jgi:hypothetical protein
MLSQEKSFLSGMAEAIQQHNQIGFYPYINEFQWAENETRRNLNEFTDMGAGLSRTLMELGIPISYDYFNRLGTIISGKSARAATKEEIVDLFKKPVYTDGESAEIICAKSDDTGIFGAELHPIPRGGTYEKFNEHNLNGEYIGYNRDGYMAARYGEQPYGIALQGAEPLSELYDYDNKKTGYYGAVINRHTLWGKTAVFGFLPWRYIHFLHKRRQITLVLDWLCGGLPVMIESPNKIAVSIWESSADAVIIFYSISFQPVQNLNFRTKYQGMVQELEKNGSWTDKKCNTESLISLGIMEPWSVKTIKIKRNGYRNV